MPATFWRPQTLNTDSWWEQLVSLLLLIGDVGFISLEMAANLQSLNQRIRLELIQAAVMVFSANSWTRCISYPIAPRHDDCNGKLLHQVYF